MILEVDKQPVGDADTLYLMLSSLKPKQRVTIMAVDHKTGEAGNVLMTLP